MILDTHIFTQLDWSIIELIINLEEHFLYKIVSYLLYSLSLSLSGSFSI